MKKNENQQVKTIKESVTYGEYVVNKLTDGGYNVVKDGTLCNNTKDALRDIALSIQFPIDNGWTTRQLGAKIVKALKDGVPQVIDNIVTAKQQGANKSRIIVELYYKEREYMGLDQDYNMVVDESFAFYDYPQSISIIVNGIELDDNAVDEVWDRLETPSNYKPFDMGKKWDNEDIERFGYYSNDAYKVWDFEIENFDIEKLCFYEEPYDAIFTQGDYNEEVQFIKLYYDNNEIEEDYDSYGCEAGNFCEQWSLYEDE